MRREPPMERPPEKRHRRRRMSLWTRFVLLVGYLTLAYGLARGVVLLLTLLNGHAA